MRLHLLDGTYELFRAHFGYPPRVSPSGMQVGAVTGLVETTLRLLRAAAAGSVAAEEAP